MINIKEFREDVMQFSKEKGIVGLDIYARLATKYNIPRQDAKSLSLSFPIWHDSFTGK